ncbi:unnamed protein product [Ambrosiozyma monospora]|uniref:Unnamed protein product n=1 Tax=Ambrosiozyma monospora TaxID=43982 RepID=A0ACB5TVT4_AMBMO|nr:unnamed protein product [Ambrosiozyma monospora]
MTETFNNKAEQVVKDEVKKGKGDTVLLTKTDIRRITQTMIDCEKVDEKDAFFMKWTDDQWNQLAQFLIDHNLEEYYQRNPTSDHSHGLQEFNDDDYAYESELMEKMGGYNSGGLQEFDNSNLGYSLGSSCNYQIDDLSGQYYAPPLPFPTNELEDQESGMRRHVRNESMGGSSGSAFINTSRCGTKLHYKPTAGYAAKELKTMAAVYGCTSEFLERSLGYIDKALKEKDLPPSKKSVKNFKEKHRHWFL